MSRTRLILITSLCALAVPIVSASSAQADTYSCAFHGATGNLASTTPGYSGVGALLHKVDDGSLGVSQDTGTYSFSTTNPGVGVPNNSSCLVVGSPNVFPIDITSNGTYANTVCGTGTATGDPAVSTGPTVGTTVESSNPSFDDVNQATYDIEFVSGQGELTITAFDSQPADGEGFVNIVPEDGAGQTWPDPGAPEEPCINQDVSVFLASGAFVATN